MIQPSALGGLQFDVYCCSRKAFGKEQSQSVVGWIHVTCTCPSNKQHEMIDREARMRDKTLTTCIFITGTVLTNLRMISGCTR